MHWWTGSVWAELPASFAHNCGFLELVEGRLALSLDPAAEHLRVPGAEARLREALERALGGPLRIDIQVARPQQETPAQRRTREAQERGEAAVASMHADPVAHRLRERLDAEWVPDSIEPAD